MMLFTLRIVGRVLEWILPRLSIYSFKDGFLEIVLMSEGCLTLINFFFRLICPSHHLLMLLIHLKNILMLLRLSPGFVKLLPWGDERIVGEVGDLIQKPAADVHRPWGYISSRYMYWFC